MSITVVSGGNSQVAVGVSNVTQIQGSTPRVAEEDLKRYVEYIFDNHATDVENCSVWEMADTFFGHELHRDDLRTTFDLMDEARVEVIVTWE